jgi:hypothetical protein
MRRASDCAALPVNAVGTGKQERKHVGQIFRVLEVKFRAFVGDVGNYATAQRRFVAGPDPGGLTQCRMMGFAVVCNHLIDSYAGKNCSQYRGKPRLASLRMAKSNRRVRPAPMDNSFARSAFRNGEHETVERSGHVGFRFRSSDFDHRIVAFREPCAPLYAGGLCFLRFIFRQQFNHRA